tara:strand:- start:710 stop:1123 length:414 start_codon:yes stop_codon:yes gene_type:complete
MTKLQLLDVIHQGLQACKELDEYYSGKELLSISMDNDNDSGEIIIDTEEEDGTKQSFVISTCDIREVQPEEEEEPEEERAIHVCLGFVVNGLWKKGVEETKAQLLELVKDRIDAGNGIQEDDIDENWEVIETKPADP